MAENTVKISNLVPKTDLILTDLLAIADSNGVAYKGSLETLQTFLSTIGVSGYKGIVTPNIGGVPQMNGADITENGNYIVSADGDYGTITGVTIANKFVLLDVKNIDTTAVYTKAEIPLNINLDATPTLGSTNAVTSEGIKSYVDSKEVATSPTPVEGGTDAFSTGGAFDELAKTKETLTTKANLIIGKNLFNKNNVSTGYISPTDGSLTGSTYSTSDFIDLENFPTDNFICNKDIRFSCFFESDKTTVVSGGWSNNTLLFVKPVNAKYGRFSFNSNINVDDAQIENGIVSTEFEDFRYVINNSEIRDNSIFGEKVTDNSIDDRKIKVKSIKPKNADFFDFSKNIFDKTDTDIIRGAYINGNGEVLSNASYTVTGYMLVEAGKRYKNNTIAASPSVYYAYYDSEKYFISSSNSSDEDLVAPANTMYRRDTLNLNATDDITNLEIQIEEGDTTTSYVSFSEIIKDKHLPDSIGTDSIGTDSQVLGEYRKSPNSLDKTDIDYEVDKYITNNALINNSSYDTTGYIPIDKENQLILTTVFFYARNVRFVCFYDENKNYIPNEDLANVSDFSYPANAKYFRCSIAKDNLDNFFIEVGLTRSQVYFDGNLDLIPSVDYLGFLKVVLPPVIYVGLGRVIEIYNNEVALFINEDDFIFRWEVFSATKSIGKNFKKKFVIDTSSNSTSLLDTYELVLTVYDKYLRVVEVASSVLKVLDMTVDIPTPLPILPVGDSLLNKPYLHEVRDLLSAKFGKTVINWIGTKNYLHGTTQDQIDIKHEGFSGFRSEQFINSSGSSQNNNLKLVVSGVTTQPVSKKVYTFTLEDTSTLNYEVEELFNENNEIFTGANGTLTYITFNALGTINSDPVGSSSGGTITETDAGDTGDSTITYSSYTDIGGNPFWNNATDSVDFSNYLTQNSLPTPNAVMTMLGTNNKTDYQSTIDFIDLVQSQLNDIPVFVIIPQYQGDYLTNISVRKLWIEHIEGLINGLKNNTNVYLIPLAQCHDSEHNCFNGYMDVNPHNTFVTERIYTADDFVHPQAWGYSQFADVIYSTILANYTNL